MFLLEQAAVCQKHMYSGNSLNLTKKGAKMSLKTNAKVNLVQGEAFPFVLEFSTPTADFVSSVYISSKELEFCHALEQGTGSESNSWSYLFTNEETVQFLPVGSTFDITVHSTLPEIDPQIATGLPFYVSKRQNPPSCEV